jgi:hypothetical protein
MDLVGRVTPIEYERQTEDSTPEPQFTVGRLIMKVSAQSREQAALVCVHERLGHGFPPSALC